MALVRTQAVGAADYKCGQKSARGQATGDAVGT